MRKNISNKRKRKEENVCRLDGGCQESEGGGMGLKMKKGFECWASAGGKKE